MGIISGWLVRRLIYQPVILQLQPPFRARLALDVRDRNPIIGDIEYVGTLEEIVEVSYTGLCVMVLICRWVRENYRGPHATVKRDRWGFTMANFESVVPLGPKFFSFPLHVEQVYFCIDWDEVGWKVVMRKEGRGKRVFQSVRAGVDTALFDIGLNTDHQGLHATREVGEENATHMPNGQNIRADEAQAVWLEDNRVFDGDVEESGLSFGDEY